MDLHAVEREPGSFQRGLTAAEIEAVCRRACGVPPERAVELGLGMYNSVYRLELGGGREPMILRVAPEDRAQFGSERRLMRNEYATVPWLAVIAPLMPRLLAVDWSHDVVDRDWMIQTCLPGIPAPEHLDSYPRSGRTTFFRQLGAITRTVHAVRGPYFGRVDGPPYTSWSQVVIASLTQIAEDLEQAGLDAADVQKAAALAAAGSATLDQIHEPRLLTGDLWTKPATWPRSASSATASATPKQHARPTRRWPRPSPGSHELRAICRLRGRIRRGRRGGGWGGSGGTFPGW